MPSAIDLTTTDQAASLLGVSASDPLLPLLVTAASTAIAKFVTYELHERSGVVERVAGYSSPYLWVKGGQVTAIQSIVVNGTTLDPSTYALDDAKHGRIVGLTQGFPFTGTCTGGIVSTPLHAHNTGAIVVTYDAGWVTPGQYALNNAKAVTLPTDIQLACLETVVAMYRRKGRDPDVQSVSLGDGSFSYGERGAIPVDARLKLLPYVKAPWGMP